MRRFHLAAYLILTAGLGLSLNAHAQSLPDEAGPIFGSHSSIPSEEAITNPDGFGRSADRKNIDASQTGSTNQEDCHRPKDIRTDRPTLGRGKLDCVR
ncbi:MULTISPECIES: hypothetical protein [unclassified Rhizobium]|uniref:hypothetical protein n=1 Tax=unclassified Rhizobium TaxID=2613769 RepID=UPI001610C2CC|nr:MULTISPECIES: hypothetical protein [unclassified Rhizobium]MBB3319599.1 hypothetical protein [Rhizobium sp. BK181]MCS4095842.1 hypothetical protein [Rhizobium sp. BK176]